MSCTTRSISLSQRVGWLFFSELTEVGQWTQWDRWEQLSTFRTQRSIGQRDFGEPLRQLFPNLPVGKYSSSKRQETSEEEGSTEEYVTHVTYFIPNEKDFICNAFTITNCLSSKKSFRVV